MDPRDRLPPELVALSREAADRRVQLCLDLLDRRIPDLTVLLEAVRRRHNVSAILRSAEAFGLHDNLVIILSTLNYSRDDSLL